MPCAAPHGMVRGLLSPLPPTFRKRFRMRYNLRNHTGLLVLKNHGSDCAIKTFEMECLSNPNTFASNPNLVAIYCLQTTGYTTFLLNGNLIHMNDTLPLNLTQDMPTDTYYLLQYGKPCEARVTDRVINVLTVSLLRSFLRSAQLECSISQCFFSLFPISVHCCYLCKV